MSRLYNPGPGEILDRISILALKCTYGKQAGKPTDHWENEALELQKLFTCQITVINIAELAAVNAAIWQAEDTMRGYRESFLNPAPIETSTQIAAGLCGCRIQSLNDRRAELVTLINTNAGINRPADKL